MFTLGLVKFASGFKNDQFYCDYQFTYYVILCKSLIMICHLAGKFVISEKFNMLSSS